MIHVGSLGRVGVCTGCAELLRKDPVVVLPLGVIGSVLQELAADHLDGQAPTVVAEVLDDQGLELVPCYGCGDTRTVLRVGVRLLLGAPRLPRGWVSDDARELDIHAAAKHGRMVFSPHRAS